MLVSIPKHNPNCPWMLRSPLSLRSLCHHESNRRAVGGLDRDPVPCAGESWRGTSGYLDFGKMMIYHKISMGISKSKMVQKCAEFLGISPCYSTIRCYGTLPYSEPDVAPPLLAPAQACPGLFYQALRPIATEKPATKWPPEKPTGKNRLIFCIQGRLAIGKHWEERN